MRILLVNAHGADRSYGGAERYVYDLRVGLRERGHEIKVLSAFPPRDESRADTIALHDTDWRDDRMRRFRNHVGDVVSMPWRPVQEILEAERPELVHTSNLPGFGTGIWECARRLGIPVAHTLLDYHLMCPRVSLTRRDGRPCDPSPLLCGVRTRRLARWAGGVGVVMGVSGFTLRRHEGFFPVAAERVVRLPMTPLAGEPLAPPQTPPAVLGYLGALNQDKGVSVLLEAAPALARQGLVLRIAGDGPLRAEVEAANDLEYVGRIDPAEVPAFIGRCDVGVVCSLWPEPGPFVINEWQAGARPVLATTRGGLAEAAERGGVISYDGTSASLVEAAKRLHDADAWAYLVANVPAVEGDVDLERWLDETEAAYALAVSPRISA